eukprot:m.74990 g.74990  ORF g.74990 m.74990 type:complete len:1118 (+) comp8955_c0_seq1:34-3387(+)
MGVAMAMAVVACLCGIADSLAPSSAPLLTSGPVSIVSQDPTTQTFSITLDGLASGPLNTMPPTVTLTPPGSTSPTTCTTDHGLACTPQSPPTSGQDMFGAFNAVGFNCTCGGVQLVYTIRAYSPGQDTPAVTARTGVVVFELAIPNGTSVNAAPLNIQSLTPAQFAPFPSFAVPSSALTHPATHSVPVGESDGPDPLTFGGMLCHGSDKNHLFDFSCGMASAVHKAAPPCGTISSGPTYLTWPSNGSRTGQVGLLASAADSFHLNYNRMGPPGVAPPANAVLYLNTKRGDLSFCADAQCIKTQIASGYTLFSVEGVPPPSSSTGPDTVPIYFSWSDANQDNWVTTSAKKPGPSYNNFGNADGALWAAQNAAGTRMAAESYVSPTGTHHVLTASAAGRAWVAARNYTSTGVLGYLDPPPTGPPPPVPGNVWSFGVSGEVQAVPFGFTQRSVFVYAQDGMNAAVDAFGATLRSGYKTAKKEDEDPFLATLSLWTDNGAATLGAGWHTTSPATPPPTPPGSSGSYLNINWSMVDTTHMGEVADSVRATGVAPRGSQLDCWWYPVNASTHPMWCGLDWQLPPEFYPEGTAGVRARVGVPLMLYFPALCVGESRWSNKGYTWTETAHLGWLLPQAPDAKAFFDDLFDYGISLATSPPTANVSRDAWPGLWVPPAVREGWKGTVVAAYETDFFWNMMAKSPSMRVIYGAGEQFLQSMDSAAAERNMTVQLCAGNVPELLKSLTLPTMTQARASIDYAWDMPDESMSASHNWAAADPGWIFWATRMGLSKDNFWTTRGAFLASLGYGADGKNGYDPELHAIIAVLTGVVGIGDWVNMTNATLVRRLARADGVLLKPDRPLSPMDRMFSSQAGAASPLSCGGVSGAARLYSTHATVAPEDKDAPELTTRPTRRLVSHTGTDATMHRTVPAALAFLGDNVLLQWLVVSVDVKCSFEVRIGDLYPPPGENNAVLYRSYHGSAACIDGADAIQSGCLVRVDDNTPTAPLFDVSTQSPSAAPCEAPNECLHEVALWQVWQEPHVASSMVMPLGDLHAYTPLAGHRFRLLPASVGRDNHAQANMSLVAVGSPNETVVFTYLERTGVAPVSWRVRVSTITIGSDGRTEFDI